MEVNSKLKVTKKLAWDDKSFRLKPKRQKFGRPRIIKREETTFTSHNEDLVQQCRLKVKEFDPSTTKYEEPMSLDFLETLVLTYPNSSKAWIMYMVFYLKQNEIEKARFVAKRAIRTICFREDQEKLNIWIAYLNLENHHGTDETFNGVFREAVTYNDHKAIYNHVIDCRTLAGKFNGLEKIAESMLKKFKKDKNVWLKIVQCFMQAGKVEEARRLLPRCTGSLKSQEYVDVLGKLAHLEFKFGDVEKSNIMFEDILMKYPKRKDLRAIYITILKLQGNDHKVDILTNTM